MHTCYLITPVVILVIVFSPVLSLNADVCRLDNVRGSCTDYSVKWYYDKEKAKCDRFWYGGCDGNLNRFDTEADCTTHCINGTTSGEVPVGCQNSRYGCCRDGVTAASGPQYQGCPSQKPTGPKCKQSKDSGTCQDYKVLWYYNTDKEICDRFWYGGCGGNDNRFSTEKDCIEACQQKEEIPTVATKTTTTTTTVKEPERANKQGKCPVVPAGTVGICVEECSNDYSCDGAQKCCSNGCGHTCQDPADETRPTEPEIGSVCALEQERGSCIDYSVLWYYNKGIGKCKRFWYGGCDGNGNRFATEDDCLAKCSRPIKPEDACTLPSVTGRCRASFKRWYFDARIQQCRTFIYGGCGGNSNRFNTRAECEKNCLRSAASTRITNFHTEKVTSNEIMLAWEPPQRNQVQNYKLEYMGVKYFRDSTKQEPLQEVVLSGKSTNYKMNNLMDAAEYTINLMPMFPGSNGPKESLVARTNPIETTVLCSNSGYGCCPDGVTSAEGPNNKGCADACQATDFGCCDDGETAATGPNQEGCDLGSGDDDNFCEQSVFGCCPDGTTPAQGANQEGCGIVVTSSTIGNKACGLKPERGRCTDYVVRWFYNSTEARCDRFWYGGCDGNQNKYETEAECTETCINSGITVKPPVTTPVCEQPKIVGPCRAALTRYYYNGRNCEMFLYGGCQGNQNNFETEEECGRRCSNAIDIDNVDETIDTCSQSMDTGPCLEHHPRWYYDSSRRDCVEFDYGGCEGNDNNFVDRDSCLRKCGAGGIDKPLDKEDEDICRMTEKEGKQCDTGVDGSIQRWFYDYSDGVCKQFTFNGCDGNKNNFATQAECESYCSRDYVCKPFVYPPFQCLAYLRRFRYDPVKKDCTEFIYGGCGGNSNNFANLNSCLKKCAPEKLVVIPDPATAPPSSWKDICNMPAETGPCRASFVKYYHNKDTLKCEQFTYGGCGGNQNQFETKEQCQQYCGESETIVDSGGSGEIDDAYCRLPKELGNCLYSIPAWYYDYTTGTCQQFIYSGCGGNENRFTSKDTCEISCKSDSATTVMATTKMTTTTPTTTTRSSISSDKAVCYLPLAEGNCKKYTARYYYDMSIKDCKPFWYTGCDGNANNFETGQQCRDRCWSGDNVIPPVYTPAPPKTTQTTVVITNFDVCNERSDRGSCTDYAVKWYFDTEEQRCKRFWYGGCDGNANNFNNETECQETCVYRVRPQPGTTQTPVRDCRLSRYGCCPDNRTPAVDRYFSNCIRTTQSPVRDCRRSAYGCCPDNKTPAVDRYFSNCNIKTDGEGSDTLVNGEYTNIVEQPGRAVTIDCLAYKSRNYEGTVSWYRDGFLVTQGSKYTITTDGALIITTSTSEDSGIYACRISSNNASPYIERYRLQIEEPVGIYPTPSKIIVRPGGTAFLHCQAYGKPKPTVTWSRSRQSLPRDPRYVVHSNGTLIISGAMEDDVGDYLCVADNRVSSPSQRSVTLELRDTLRAKIDPINGRLREGERLYLHCNGYGFPVPTIEWEKSGRPLSSDQRVSVISGNLRVANVALEDTGLYTCIVSNDEEKVEASVSVQVIPQDVKPDNCVDKASSVKCRLIVRARLCGYSIYSKQCCNSCEQEKRRLLGRQK